MKNLRIIVEILLVIIVVYLYHQNQKNVDIVETNNYNLSVLNDSLITYKNKYGNSVSTIRSLEIKNLEDLERYAELDSSLSILAREMREMKRKFKDVENATHISTNTILDGINNNVTTIINNGDTIYKSDITQFGEWVSGTHSMGKNFSHIDMSIKNDYILTLSYSRAKGLKNMFKPKRPVAHLTNLNPYTNTTDLNVIKIKETPKKGFGLTVGLYHGWDLDLNRHTIVGFGISKTLIEF